MATPLAVLDISHYQPTPDWRALKAAGIVGVILKATEGTSFVDKTFKSRYRAALDHGLAVASYHFLKHGSVQAQMDFYFDTVQPRPGERMIVDFEDASCTLDDLRNAVTALTVNDVEVTVYGANGFLGSLLDGQRDDLLATTSLWVASYTSAAAPTMTDLKATWPAWSLWQFTDVAKVGNLYPVDGNRFNGSLDACILWLEPRPPTPAPGPRPGPVPAERPTVVIHIDSDQPVYAVVTVGDNVTLSGTIPPPS